MLQYLTHVVFSLGVDRGAVSEACQLVGTIRLVRSRNGRGHGNRLGIGVPENN